MKNNAIIFPGQGAQAVGMGKDSYDVSSDVQEIYHMADKIAAQGLSISEVSFNGPEDQLTRTIYTQPAILTLSIALAKQVREAIASGKLDQPKYVAGHSLGEFAALYMADVLSLEDVIKLVCKRAALMEEAPPGAMTAIIGLDQEKLDSIIDSIDGASVANYNSPDQIVATGTQEAMTQLAEAVSKFAEENSLRVKVISLSVGGAFHSPLMQEASDKFAQEIDACGFNDASIPVIQNINAQVTTNADDIKANLKQQMTGSVQWTKTVAQLIDENDGVATIYEIGPGKVLAGLVKKQNRRFPVTNIQSIQDLEQIFANGVTVNS